MTQFEHLIMTYRHYAKWLFIVRCIMHKFDLVPLCIKSKGDTNRKGGGGFFLLKPIESLVIIKTKPLTQPTRYFAKKHWHQALVPGGTAPNPTAGRLII